MFTTFFDLASLNIKHTKKKIWENLMKIKSTTMLVILFASIFIYSEDFSNKAQISAIKTEKIKINFDGKLTDECWKTEPISHFTQRDPNEGISESEKTEAWVVYDEEYIYVGARLFDSKPDSIDASLARRDWYFDSDWFTVFIDPYNDKKTGYYFKVNAGGAMCDGILYNDSWDSDTWDGIWESKTCIDENGWSIEMRIPFSQLRFKESDKMTWGVNFSRQIKRKNERSYYIMVPKKESGFVSKFAQLEGLSGIKPKQRFEVIPYMVQKAQYLKHDQGDPFYKSNQYRTTFGADIKVGIGSNLNLDATINPDFGQVEVDPAVINLSAFESYFNEKRPFFIEGANLFEFGFGGSNSYSSFNFGIPELLYTRRIGRSPHGDVSDNDYVNYPGETRILGAAKLTGKINDNTSVGVLSATTERTFATLANKDNRTTEEVEPLTHYGAMRARSEFNNGSQAIGFMLTSVNRDLNDNDLKTKLAKEAYVFGLDGWSFLDKDQEYVMTGAFAASYTSGSKEYLQNLQQRSYRYFQRPDATYAVFDSSKTSLSGGYGRVMLNKQKGNFYINAALGAVTPGFEQNDIGFQFMADRINGHLLLGYFWYEPDNIFRSKKVMAAYARSTDFEGNTISNFLWYNSNFQFLNYWGFQLGFNYSMEAYSRSLTRGGPLSKYPAGWNINMSAYSDSRKDVQVSGYGNYSIDKMEGGNYYMGFSVVWKPDPRFYISLEPNYSGEFPVMQWIDNFSDPEAKNTYNTRYVFANMLIHTLDVGIRVNYTFTPALSLQLYLQPFLSAATYSHFKELAKPKTYDINEFGKNGSTIKFDANSNTYTVDPDGTGPANTFSFDNPDFNYKSLRGTAVLRWEVKPGTLLYLVWSHNQSDSEEEGRFELGRDFRQLIKTEADNILMVKFSYWLNI